MSMRVFLTGGTGYIGSAVLDAFVKAGHHVTALVRTPEGAERVETRGARPHPGRLEDPDSYAAAAGEHDAYVLTAFDHGGQGVRIEQFVAAYGIRGGTMTGLLRYDLDLRYRDGRLGADGRFVVPEEGTVTIELLDRLLGYAESDPTGVLKRALGNLRAFDFKSAEATVRTAGDGMRVSLSLQGRERLGIFPPRVREINVQDMPLGFLAREFPRR